MKISIATTIFNSADYIDDFYKKSLAAIKSLRLKNLDYEFVFVDDGSQDNSYQIVKKLAAKDKKIKIIKLSRNFGHHKARITSIIHSSGDLVFYLDSDLEEDPKNLKQFYQTLKSQENLEMVYACRDNRSEHFSKKNASLIFHFFFRYLTNFHNISNIVSSRLMTKAFVNKLLLFKETEIYSVGIFELIGCKRKKITIEKSYKGKSSYNLSRNISLATKAILSFSNKPLYFIPYLGALMIALSLFFFVILQPNILLFSIWFNSGIIISSISVLALYLGEIMLESKNRPRVIIEEIINDT